MGNYFPKSVTSKTIRVDPNLIAFSLTIANKNIPDTKKQVA
jgi:hypothetical protein